MSWRQSSAYLSVFLKNKRLIEKISSSDMQEACPNFNSGENKQLKYFEK